MNESIFAVITLIVILPLIILTIYGLKKFLLKLPKGNQNIQITSQIQIGSKEKILMIEAHGQSFLIGATPENINTLHEFGAIENKPSQPHRPAKKKPLLWGQNHHE